MRAIGRVVCVCILCVLVGGLSRPAAVGVVPVTPTPMPEDQTLLVFGSALAVVARAWKRPAV